MKIEQLTEIIKLAEKVCIISRLTKLGYIDCKKHKQYKHISLVDLFKGNDVETDEYPDSKGKRTYQGGIFTQVKGYEQLEFVIVNINDDKHHFPIDMLIWAKEI